MILQNNIVGKMSDAHRQALNVVFDCCDTPIESWNTFSDLIEQSDNDEKVMEILSQLDDTGQSLLERTFICKSLAAMEITRNASNTILQQAEQLTEEQRLYVEILHKNCQGEIAVWKEIAEYFS